MTNVAVLSLINLTQTVKAFEYPFVRGILFVQMTRFLNWPIEATKGRKALNMYTIIFTTDDL